jgi:hypothetical protein
MIPADGALLALSAALAAACFVRRSASLSSAARAAPRPRGARGRSLVSIAAM